MKSRRRRRSTVCASAGSRSAAPTSRSPRPTTAFRPRDRSLPIVDQIAAKQLAQLETNCREFGIRCLGIHSDRQGIVHVIGPELGLTQPGMTVVCGDSHTATHGAFGALAFGIGTSEVEHVLATQCLLQRKSKTFQVRVEGKLKPGVSAKDIILALIAQIGVGGGTGCVFEFTGSAIRALSMEERMTVCNMSIEGGARAGLIAPDETTFEYLKGRPHAPQGRRVGRRRRALEAASDRRGRRLRPQHHDRRRRARADDHLRHQPRNGHVDHRGAAGRDRSEHRQGAEVHGSRRRHSRCSATPSTWSSSGAARIRASPTCAPPPRLLKGRKVNPKVRVMVVPGSQEVKRQAIAEGLPEIFRAAGCEWREPGCSMCIAMNGDQLSPGQYSVSTSNRNFEGRQGKGGRTFLASPLTAAASAITGVVTDVRTIL